MHSIDKGQVLWELILTSLTDQVYHPRSLQYLVKVMDLSSALRKS